MIKLSFESFVANYNLNQSIRDTRKNCIVQLDLDYPDGWSFGLSKVAGEAIGSMESFHKSFLRVSHYSSGVAAQSAAQVSFDGPLDGLTPFAQAFQPLVWSPCGARRSVSLNMTASLNARSRHPGHFGLSALDPDSIVDEPYMDVQLVWRRCR